MWECTKSLKVRERALKSAKSPTNPQKSPTNLFPHYSAPGVDEYRRNVLCEFALAQEQIYKHMYVFSPAQDVDESRQNVFCEFVLR